MSGEDHHAVKLTLAVVRPRVSSCAFYSVPMKHLLLALLLVSFVASSAFADSPAQISADYRKQAAAALTRLNETLEKATVPLIAALVKAGDTDGATGLREQMKTKTTRDTVMKPQTSAAALFTSYDAARIRALEPAQKAAVSRIDAMLSSSEGKKLDVVTELGKVRAEIEAGRVVASSSFPSTWTYHKNEDSVPMADLTLTPDGTWSLVDILDKATTTGTWRQTGDTSADLNTGKLIWKLDYKAKSGVIVRPDIGNRYLKLVHK
ncbi:MAG: hypothetical protein JWR15_591 [Prosthecobacter sp.]|nr:hypothetical protein [Prosthecobacter sp.]